MIIELYHVYLHYFQRIKIKFPHENQGHGNFETQDKNLTHEYKMFLKYMYHKENNKLMNTNLLDEFKMIRQQLIDDNRIFKLYGYILI